VTSLLIRDPTGDGGEDEGGQVSGVGDARL
jgi:hypothetical protein